MLGRKQKLTSVEWDVTSSWKQFYSYLNKPGISKKIKRGMNRRERRKLKKELRNDYQIGSD